MFYHYICDNKNHVTQEERRGRKRENRTEFSGQREAVEPAMETEK